MTKPFDVANEAPLLKFHVANDYLALTNISILNTEDYLRAVEKFEASVLSLVRLHRDWNDETETVNFEEDAYDHDYDNGAEGLPFGWSEPTPAEEVTDLERIALSLYLNVRLATLSRLTLNSTDALYRMNSIMDDFMEKHNPIPF